MSCHQNNYKSFSKCLNLESHNACWNSYNSSSIREKISLRFVSFHDVGDKIMQTENNFYKEGYNENIVMIE